MLGRFAQADTIVPGAGNPLAWDRYAYALNAPVVYRDPSGHSVDCGPYEAECQEVVQNEEYDKLIQDIINDPREWKDLTYAEMLLLSEQGWDPESYNTEFVRGNANLDLVPEDDFQDEIIEVEINSSDWNLYTAGAGFTGINIDGQDSLKPLGWPPSLTVQAGVLREERIIVKTTTYWDSNSRRIMTKVDRYIEQRLRIIFNVEIYGQEFGGEP